VSEPSNIDDSARRKIRRWLMTDAGMARFLDQHAGTGMWTYDRQTDCWIFRDDRLHHGPGRCFVVMRRGGDWHTHVLPEEVLQ
jgi:hypothetical protein